MSRTDNIYLEPTNLGAMLTNAEYDTAHPHLNEMVEIVGSYVKSTELAENTSDQIDEAEQTMGGYSEITSHRSDKADIETVTILIRRQSSRLLSQFASRSRHFLSHIHEDGQAILNPKVIRQIPSIGCIVTVTDWGTEPPTPDVRWKHTHKSASPYFPDIIAEREYNTAPLLFSMWQEPLTVNADPEIDKEAVWTEILERFDVIAQREDNWDGLESQKPIEESLVRGKRLIEKLLADILFAGYSWHMFKPLISSDEDGYITVRWRGQGKRLHLLIEEDEVRYIKSWRINTKRKVSTERTRSDNCFEIWAWLING